MKQTEQLLNHALDFVISLLAEGQSIDPKVFIHCSGKLLAIPYKDPSPEAEGFLKAKIVAVIRAMRAAGQLDGVVMVGEGWMSCVKPGQAEFPRPSEDPNRVECVQVVAWGREGRKMAAYRILTKEERRVIGTSVLDSAKMDIRIWLDPAFEDIRKEATLH
jgi:hypothetical protein